MFELKQTETFGKWFAQLRDERAIAAIVSRLDRLVLLCGGDKKSQARDIKAALRLADEWSESP